MKHLFRLVDKLLFLLKKVPKGIKNRQEADDARTLIKSIQQYSHSIKIIVEDTKNSTVYLRRIHESHHDVIHWSEQVKEVFEKLDYLLIGLEEYMDKLSKIIEYERYSEWGNMIGNLAMRMVMIGLHDDEETLDRLRKLEIVEVDQLKELIKNEEHIAKLLK